MFGGSPVCFLVGGKMLAEDVNSEGDVGLCGVCKVAQPPYQGLVGQASVFVCGLVELWQGESGFHQHRQGLH